jgi:hypothetical protein
MRLGVAAVAAALIALALPGVASAEIITVNRFDDHTPASCPADCTLRAAVAAATTTEDAVSVPAGRYTLTSQLILDGPNTIVGAGARQTIVDAGGTSRVATVTGTTSIGYMTITGGNGNTSQGGAFLVQADAGLGLSSVAVEGNTSVGPGGGIASLGALVLIASTVSGNEIVSVNGSGLGGGIYASGGSAALTLSTVSGNTASGAGGGVWSDVALQLQQSTIAANQAPSGGGVFQDPAAPSMIITDTLIADNTVGACGGTITIFSGDHNLADDMTCSFVGPGDLQGVDAQLDPLANNGGETNTHALAAGSPAIDARPPPCSSSDQRGYVRPAGAGCDIGAYEFGAVPPFQPPPTPPLPPPTQPPPPPPPTDQLPPPVAGETVNALRSRGTVRIKVPGSNKFIVLEEGQQVPVGTVFDTTKGRVTLIAASDKQGGTQQAWFYTGIFKLKQTKGSKPITTLELTEKLSCGKKSGKASAAARKKKKRQLWGDGKGRFRTEGDFSSATVRGTKWLTQDRCDSTLTRVVRGKVEVRDFVKRKTVIVRAGKQYLAKRKK